MIEYAGILILSFFAAALTGLFIFLTSVLGPKRPSEAKNVPYESGMKPFAPPNMARTSVHFYVIAMLFIIFDVEIAFLFPWAVIFRELGVLGLTSIAIFVGVILLGFVYALKKGALEPS